MISTARNCESAIFVLSMLCSVLGKTTTVSNDGVTVLRYIASVSFTLTLISSSPNSSNTEKLKLRDHLLHPREKFLPINVHRSLDIRLLFCAILKYSS